MANIIGAIFVALFLAAAMLITFSLIVDPDEEDIPQIPGLNKAAEELRRDLNKPVKEKPYNPPIRDGKG